MATHLSCFYCKTQKICYEFVCDSFCFPCAHSFLWLTSPVEETARCDGCDEVMLRYRLLNGLCDCCTRDRLSWYFEEEFVDALTFLESSKFLVVCEHGPPPRMRSRKRKVAEANLEEASRVS